MFAATALLVYYEKEQNQDIIGKHSGTPHERW